MIAMFDILLKVACIILLIIMLVFLLKESGKRQTLAGDGWRMIIWGFYLLLFGSVMGLAGEFAFIRAHMVFGQTDFLAILAKLVGLVGGLLLLSVGLWRWLPTIDSIDGNRAELTQLIEQQKEFKEQIKNANQTKSLFLATLSHEIRTPLNGIMGYCKLLENLIPSCVDSECIHNIKQLKKTSLILRYLIDNILYFLKIEAGHVELQYDPVALQPFLEKLVAQFMPEAKERGNFLHLSCDPYIGVVLVDQIKLQQILLNLLSNANKFTEAGEIELSVQMAVGADKTNRFTFSIQDTGVGIPKGEQELLSNKFSQLDNSLSRQLSGHGFGLAICKGLVDKMGGEITIKSVPDEGSLFCFTLELVAGKLAKTQKAAIVPERKSGVGNRDEGCTSCRILLVEDDYVSQEFLNDWLQKKGHKVTLAANGLLGLQIFKTEEFDLVLTDVRMPIMDGISLVKHIRDCEDSQRSEIPVVAITADVVPERITACLEAGMDEVVTKPVDLKNMAAIIKKAVSGSRLRAMPFGAVADQNPTAATVEILEVNVLQQILESLGMEVLDSVSEKLVYTGERTFNDLDRCLAKGDSDGVKEAAHLMKGAALHLGLQALSIMAIKIENLAVAGELEQISEQLPEFQQLFDSSLQTLREWKRRDSIGG